MRLRWPRHRQRNRQESGGRRLLDSSFRRVDERHSAAANTVSGECFGHVNVDDVDTGGLGIGDSLLDGAIQAGCGVVDLGLEGQVRIALDKLKQERIASGHDECVGRRSATSAYRSVRRLPSSLSSPHSAGKRRYANRMASWHCAGVPAVQAASTPRDPNQPLQRSESPTLCFVSAPTTAPRPHRTSLPRCRRR